MTLLTNLATESTVPINMGTGFASVTESEGVLMASADVNGFTVGELRFPPGYVQADFEPELPYIAVVLDGSLRKSFRRQTISLGRADGVTMPAGAAHGARFGSDGARIVIVKANSPSSLVADHLDRLVRLDGCGFSRLGWLLAAELRAADAMAPLAAEGIALELLAAATREATADCSRRAAPRWLVSAEEMLRTRTGDCIRLSDLAGAVGVHPIHLARTFRARHGVSVGEYGRRVRIEWAAAEIARGGSSLAAVAAEAGFADQSHFTRLFKRYVGTTPARFRAAQARRVPG
jgi:AraC family transcriptional regulator